jgi:hypothetical protein
MSIYATLWEIKLPKAHAFDEEWVRVYAQAVPPHIGHPSQYRDGDPYADFLPPVVEYDPELDHGDVYRAVVILVEGRDEKIEQRYVDPLMTLTGKEYASIPFGELLERIQDAIPWDIEVAGYSIGPNGERKVIRVPGWRAAEDGNKRRIEAIIRDRREQLKS